MNMFDPNILRSRINELKKVIDCHRRISFLLDKEANIFNDESNRNYYIKESPDLFFELAYAIYNKGYFNQAELLDIRKDHKKKGIRFDDNKYFLECKTNAARAIEIYEYMINCVFDKEGYEHDKIRACISLSYIYYQEAVAMHLNTKYMNSVYGGYNVRNEFKKKAFSLFDYVINNKYAKPYQICKCYYRKAALSRELSTNGKCDEFVSISEKFTTYFYGIPQSIIDNDRNGSIRHYYLRHCYDKICSYNEVFDGLYWSHVLYEDDVMTERSRPFGGYDTRIEEYRIKDDQFLKMFGDSLAEYIYIGSNKQKTINVFDINQIDNIKAVCDELSTFGKETITRERIGDYANVLYRFGEFYTIYYISGIERGNVNIGSVETLRAAYRFYMYAIQYNKKALENNMTYLYEHMAKIRILNGEHKEAIKTIRPYMRNSYEVYTVLYCYVITMNHGEFDKLFNEKVNYGSVNYIVRELCNVFFTYLNERKDVNKETKSYNALTQRIKQIEESENNKKERQKQRYQYY